MPVEADQSVEADPAEAAPPAAGPELVLTVTPEAGAKILEIRAAEDDPDTLCLRVGVIGAEGPEYTYDLGFEAEAEVAEGHHLSEQGGLVVAVPLESVDQLRGAVLDVPSSSGQAGLVIRNPNRPNPLAGHDLELTGELADKVTQLLEGSINPSLASHGGFAALAGVDGTKVFLTMGGGCQGCAMSAATLREGIQVAIKEAIPEVTDVVDVTDHDAGDSPFYS
jgi:Fe/S biogenesis protein NfuA